ncbi:hypothetical protein Tco_0617903 [Tanacetum coccineum]
MWNNFTVVQAIDLYHDDSFVPLTMDDDEVHVQLFRHFKLGTIQIDDDFVRVPEDQFLAQHTCHQRPFRKYGDMVLWKESSWEFNRRRFTGDMIHPYLQIPESVVIKVPRHSTNKGSGSHTRWKHMDELIQNEAESSKKRRTCFVCGRAEGYNCRTCPYKDAINAAAANKRTKRSTRSPTLNYKE